jgi:hypothetical protein
MLWRLKILCGQGEAGKLMEQGLLLSFIDNVDTIGTGVNLYLRAIWARFEGQSTNIDGDTLKLPKHTCAKCQLMEQTCCVDVHCRRSLPSRNLYSSASRINSECKYGQYGPGLKTRVQILMEIR